MWKQKKIIRQKKCFYGLKCRYGNKCYYDHSTTNYYPPPELKTNQKLLEKNQFLEVLQRTTSCIRDLFENYDIKQTNGDFLIGYCERKGYGSTWEEARRLLDILFQLSCTWFHVLQPDSVKELIRKWSPILAVKTNHPRFWNYIFAVIVPQQNQNLTLYNLKRITPEIYNWYQFLYQHEEKNDFRPRLITDDETKIYERTNVTFCLSALATEFHLICSPKYILSKLLMTRHYVEVMATWETYDFLFDEIRRQVQEHLQWSTLSELSFAQVNHLFQRYDVFANGLRGSLIKFDDFRLLINSQLTYHTKTMITLETHASQWVQWFMSRTWNISPSSEYPIDHDHRVRSILLSLQFAAVDLYAQINEVLFEKIPCYPLQSMVSIVHQYIGFSTIDPKKHLCVDSSPITADKLMYESLFKQLSKLGSSVRKI